VASIITFQIGADDAKILKDELAPIFDMHDIINLGAREIYVKMTIDGKRFDPFSADVLEVTTPKHESLSNKLIENARKQFAKPRTDVEAELEAGDKEINAPAVKVEESEIVV
jgi:hypothetical protein